MISGRHGAHGHIVVTGSNIVKGLVVAGDAVDDGVNEAEVVMGLRLVRIFRSSLVSFPAPTVRVRPAWPPRERWFPRTRR